MKTKFILTVIAFLTSVIGLQAQDLLRPDSRLLKPSPFSETLKPSIDAFRNINELQKSPLDIPDTLPATWSAFKLKFISLPLSEEFTLLERFYRNMEMGKNYQDSIWFDPQEHFSTRCRMISLSGCATGGGGGVSFIQQIYDEYSHEGKMRRKYDSILLQDEIERRIYPKYNVELVKQLTGFTSDSAAYTFMRFCDFKNDSLLMANNYDVYMMIRNCLTQFLKTEH